MNLACPQCGFILDLSKSRNIKLSICSSCHSSLLIENNSVSMTALNVAKNTEQSLFEVDNVISINNKNYTPNGYCLYQYQGGRKVEWELSASDVTDSSNDSHESTYFLNQEDENLFLVKQITAIDKTLPTWESLQVNTHLKIRESEWLVVEQLKVKFASYYGALKNLSQEDIELKCIYLSNIQGECLVLSFNHQNGLVTEPPKAYQGWWLDPMDLT